MYVWDRNIWEALFANVASQTPEVATASTSTTTTKRNFRFLRHEDQCKKKYKLYFMYYDDVQASHYLFYFLSFLTRTSWRSWIFIFTTCANCYSYLLVWFFCLYPWLLFRYYTLSGINIEITHTRSLLLWSNVKEFNISQYSNKNTLPLIAPNHNGKSQLNFFFSINLLYPMLFQHPYVLLNLQLNINEVWLRFIGCKFKTLTILDIKLYTKGPVT